MIKSLIQGWVKKMSDSIEDAVKDLHHIIREHWCDEFEYGESCKHCIIEPFCDRLIEAMYPGLMMPPSSELGENSE